MEMENVRFDWKGCGFLQRDRDIDKKDIDIEDINLSIYLYRLLLLFLA